MTHSSQHSLRSLGSFPRLTKRVVLSLLYRVPNGPLRTAGVQVIFTLLDKAANENDVDDDG